ncbi:hypothetical protein DITRI_Ditri03aG0057800 [Diplodiscus trichospermus]
MEMAPCVWKVGRNMYGISFKTKEILRRLPIELMTRRNAEVIGMRLGRVVEIDDQWIMRGIGRAFMRIRVGIKVAEPQIEGFWLSRGEKGRTWIQIRYEKLAEFCFSYGMLGHFLNNYGNEVKRTIYDQEQLRYGLRLRATVFRKLGREEYKESLGRGMEMKENYISTRKFNREGIEIDTRKDKREGMNNEGKREGERKKVDSKYWSRNTEEKKEERQNRGWVQR